MAGQPPAAEPLHPEPDKRTAASPTRNDTPPERRAAALDAGPAHTPHWLLRHRVTVPERALEFFDRPALIARAAPTAHRLTVLLAPGGFGKTTLLAECCRQAAAQGLPTAWLTLEANDTPEALDTYLAFAFQTAGIDPDPALGGSELALRYPRTALMLRAVEALGKPCLLALDEAERLAEPEAVALLNFLVRAAPPGLHLAIAGRELPRGLDILDPVLNRHATLITTEDLRFSQEDVAAFFGASLTRAQLDAVLATSEGWPIALRLQRNASTATEFPGADAAGTLIDGWLASSLWDTLTEPDRELLTVASQFEWQDAGLLGDVLGDHRAFDRLMHIQQLTGLLRPARGADAPTLSLHPLLRDHCARRLREDDPPRHAEVHRRIARAMARRGLTVDAMRHAAEARDSRLAARILHDAGGLRLWLGDGLDCLAAATRFLPAEAAAADPRLALAQCAAEAVSGRLGDARRTFASVPRPSPDTDRREDLDILADRCLARALIGHYGCESAFSEETTRTAEDIFRLTESPAVDPSVRAAMQLTAQIAMNLHAMFDEALERGRLARRLAGDRLPFLTAATYQQNAQAAMARGRVADAVAWLARGDALARTTFLTDARLGAASNLYRRELELEQNRLTDSSPDLLSAEMDTQNPLTTRLIAADIATELTRAAHGVDAAITRLDELEAGAIRGDLTALRRHLCARRADLLAAAGRIDEAERTWLAAALPRRDDDCTSLLGQSWREAESVSCARIRLLAAKGDIDAARRLAAALIATSTECGLRRTAMRAHALSLAVEHDADDAAAAQAHLAAFLELYAETPYSHCLVRERDAAQAVLAHYLDTARPGAAQDAARGLLAELRASRAAPRLSARETDVLERISAERDEDIAAALGLTRAGVRYHVRNLFKKLGVRGRREAARRARELGLLPPRH